MILKKLNPKTRKAYFILQTLGFKNLPYNQRQILEQIEKQGYQWDENRQEWFKN